MSRLRVTLRRSPIGRPKNQKETARALGLTKLQRTVIRPDTPAIRGMVNTIGHLVTVEQIEDGEKG
jgi:large subunit ribosomal protein L30